MNTQTVRCVARAELILSTDWTVRGMAGFVIGVFVGAGMAMMIIGFLAAVAEDKESKPQPPKEWRWYMEDDGK